jgi:simple sugar transport system ATP-binding protein
MGIHNDDAYRKGIFINHNKLDELTNSFIEDYEIKLPSKDSIITSLSGGNVQKCIFAREIFNAKELIITEEPTRGVDIGAIEFIHEQLISKSKDGYGVLLVSTDLDEIISLSTKILVIYCGRIVGIVNPEEEGFENKIALMMGGVESVG